MYDYLKEIPPEYKQEYKSLVNNALPAPFGTQERYDFVKYQLIIIAYREESFIGDCVESLINQTTSPYEFEVLIVNNCSIEEELDNTEIVVKEKLDKYKYDNIHLINVKFPNEIQGAALAAKFGIDVALHRWSKYDDFNDGIVAFFGADNVFENHYVEEVLKTFKNPSKYENPFQLNPIGLGEDRLDILVTNCDTYNFTSLESVIDISKLKPYINEIETMNGLLGKWYYNNFDIVWGIKKDEGVSLDKNLLYRVDDGTEFWPKTFRAKIYNDLGGIGIQPQEEQAIIVKAVKNNCVIKYNDKTNFTHIDRLEKPRVFDGSMTQTLHDSSEAYINNSELTAYQLDYWTMRNNIEKYFYERKFYDDWKPNFFTEQDLDKILVKSGESYLYYRNKFIYQFQEEINKIYKKISIDKVINDIRNEI